MAPAGNAPPPAGEKVPAPKKDEKKSEISSPARMLVELPADAKLYVDDTLMKTQSDKRVFNTPSLEAGQTYYYDLRVELMRDGQKITQNQRVIVHAGEQIQASFQDMDKRSMPKREMASKD